jgi:hypothetical protein
MMKSIKISPCHFLSSDLYRSMQMSANIVADSDGVAYIPLSSISNNLDESCILKSMTNTENGYLATYLKGGFF